MKVNADKLMELAQKEGWSIPELANRLGVDYSYLFRVLKKSKNGGGKLFNGLYQLCKEKDLNIEEYIFLQKTLSTNNDKKEVI
ncbi:helix-turn-helix domain-containing protein [Paenibacillus tianjinensis]|uniref:XRE family transcriptional regulator n=1 Tax=Paenibacillus tianjinensis TaxID=2810347 RepID=A0ABX7L499_9BACL|nr:helix-turn-helix domain-containing protein [Paenibacillus tianjinensis]QSF42705.1 hypothetical protein JRJ22_15425 [Paenibacillus tianjinensis]